MRKFKTDPEGIWTEYSAAQQYNTQINLYDTVRKNENFFVGKQWEGVMAPDLDKPVINILKRVVAYFLSNIVSDDVAAQVVVKNDTEGIGKILSTIVAQVIEYTKMKSKQRDLLRNAAVDGDGCFYVNFDPGDADVWNENKVGGNIEVELVDNTNIMFGNAQVNDVQKQPYILIYMRKLLDEVLEEAEANGQTTDGIIADGPDSNIMGAEVETNQKVSVILKLWKEKGTVWATKVTSTNVIKPKTDLQLKLYPVSWMSWDKVKNSYHGQAAISGMIPNQIFINKLFAMGMEHVKKTAFPKIIFNEALLPDGWDNRVGEAIPVQGDPNMAVMSATGVPDMSNQVMIMIDRTVDMTRDTMGATDAALGNVRPDNTSAIIAVQKASAAPLELQRMAFYQFVEDTVRILLDVMRVNFGTQPVVIPGIDDNSVDQEVLFDFSRLGDLDFDLNIDVGTSAYWSELMQIQTLDNLFMKGVIEDPEMYVDAMPDGYIPNKQQLLAKLRRMRQQQEQQAMMEQMQAQGITPNPEDVMQIGPTDEAYMKQYGVDQMDMMRGIMDEPMQFVQPGAGYPA